MSLQCLSLIIFIGVTGTVRNNQVFATGGTDPQVVLTSPSGGTILNGSVTISANPTASAGVNKVEFYDGASLLNTVLSAPYSMSWDTTTINAGIHLLTAVVYDNSNATATSPEISTLKPDLQPPTTPTNLHTSSSTISSLTLSWDASTDNVGVIGYRIYKNNSILTTTTSLTFTDTGLNPTTTYNYGVSSYDGSFNQSGIVSASFTTPADITPPSVPTGLGSSNITDSSLRISWSASTDNGYVAGYNIYRNSILIGNTSQTYYDDSNLRPLTDYTYNLVAYDGANNQSTASNDFIVSTTVDVTPPSVPTGLGSSNITDSSLRISWSASTDNGVLSGYDVYRNNVLLGTTTHAYFDDSGLSPLTSYTYKVDAYDSANNKSVASSNYATSTTVDVTPPSVPSGLSSSNITDSSQRISWSASTDNGVLSGYDVYRNNVLLGTTAQTYYDDSALSPLTGYTYKIKAYDSVNNTSLASSNYVVSTIADAIPPSTPTGLQITTADSTSQQIAWTASTDDIAVTGYYIYINGLLLGNTNQTSFTSSHLTPLTSYTYQVEAYDAAANVSGLSSSITGSTTADTIAPVVAFGNGITNGLSVIGSLQINGSATDNFAMSSIKLYIDSTLVSSGTNSISYTWDSTTGSLGAHTLRLDASDTSNNLSSTSVSVTVKPVPRRGDVNNDYVVNIFDLSILLSHWKRNYPPADLDKNGIVNIFDLSILLSQYGK